MRQINRRASARHIVGPDADRGRRSGALLRAAVGCALVLAVAGGGGLSGSSTSLAHESAPEDPTYTLMQMNLCLSGYAGCYGEVGYPAGIEEAVGMIREVHPDAVTVNEGCRRDVARIARRTGYHVRFSTVTSSGDPLPCVRPGGRGRFGNAILTKARVANTYSHDFTAQVGIEWRRWLCVSTRDGVDVCTAHLATRSTVASAANDAQCAELAALLERRARTRTVIFGGDANRRDACAPERAWIRTDELARQAPGLQGVYGTGDLHSPSAELRSATHTDHDILVVRASRRGSSKGG